MEWNDMEWSDMECNEWYSQLQGVKWIERRGDSMNDRQNMIGINDQIMEWHCIQLLNQCKRRTTRNETDTCVNNWCEYIDETKWSSVSAVNEVQLSQLSNDDTIDVSRGIFPFPTQSIHSIKKSIDTVARHCVSGIDLKTMFYKVRSMPGWQLQSDQERHPAWYSLPCVLICPHPQSDAHSDTFEKQTEERYNLRLCLRKVDPDVLQ